MILEDSVVLVVGASGGVGSATAAALSRRGARVVVHGREGHRLEAAAADAGAKWLALDLTRPDAPETLVAAAREVHGRIDAVVHCAGLGWFGDTATMTPETVDRLIAVNLSAPLRVTSAVLDEMRARGSGHLCFVSSIAGWVGVTQESVYSAVKAGVIAYADALRAEVRPDGIGVSVVSPGAVDTAFFAQRGEPYGRHFPRPLTPERVADVIVRSVETGAAHRMVPRWLALAPAVRATLPGPYRYLDARFGQTPRPRER